MANNIYDISDWSAATVYKKNNVVKYLNNYFYSLINSNVGNTPSVSSSAWGGRGYSPVTNEEMNEFIWSASYGINIDPSPKIKQISFGGYTQRLPDSINNNLLNIEAIFDGRDADESLGIVHFLSARGGTNSFLWTPPGIFAKKKFFICSSFPTSINFFENNSIKCIFEENPI